MDISKRLQNRLIFLFLVIFPFGHLVRIDFSVFGLYAPFHPIDAAAGLTIPFFVLIKKRPMVWKSLAAFLSIAFFSYLFSLFFFGQAAVKGFLYLLRLFAYMSLFVFVWDFVKRSPAKKRMVFDGLVLVIVAIAVFGWIQYFLYPDFRAFTIYEWDDHLYRMVSTFFDPGFTSILLVFGIMASIVQFLEFRDRKWMFLGGFLLLSLLFTYSRAGYLAFFAGLLTLAAMKKYMKLVLFSILLFLAALLFLPRPAGEGVKLERTASIYARLENYSESVEIIRNSPLLGVGYNNLCVAREVFLQEADYSSHACYGADSSLLFVFASTGIVGLSTFIYLLYKMATNVSNNIYGQTFLASGAAVLFHSIFVNSIFYAWVMGWMGCLLAVAVKRSSLR